MLENFTHSLHVLNTYYIAHASNFVAMADFKTSASSVVHSFLAMYLMLWNSLKTVFGGLYSGLRTLSTVYPPAKQFLTNLENTIHRLKTDPAACADLKLNPQHLLQEFWTPSTVLEGLVSSPSF